MSLAEEKWSPLKEYPSYEISNLGRVHRLNAFGKRNTFLKASVVQGYLMVRLSEGGSPENVFIHRLVATYFTQGDTTLKVNHKDLDKLNNVYSNLEWVTQKRNIQHYWESQPNRVS